jgi:hypothetical protein
MPTTTNYGWTTPADTDLVKDGASAIRTLGTAIDTTTKNLNPSTTLGDIEYRSSTANTNTRLAIGTTGQVLTVSGGVPAWTTVASGSMTLLETLTLTGASVTSSTIAGTYNDLYIVIRNFRPATDGQYLNMRVNGDSGTRYSNTSLNVSSLSNQSFGDTSFRPVTMDADDGASNMTGIIQIFDYANTSTWKMTNYQAFVNGATTPTNWSYIAGRGIYNQTSAITTITLLTNSGNITSGSALIYGVK